MNPYRRVEITADASGVPSVLIDGQRIEQLHDCQVTFVEGELPIVTFSLRPSELTMDCNAVIVPEIKSAMERRAVQRIG
jgi:hypothetical protein